MPPAHPRSSTKEPPPPPPPPPSCSSSSYFLFLLLLFFRFLLLHCCVVPKGKIPKQIVYKTKKIYKKKSTKKVTIHKSRNAR
jgi:hypothetical protein